MSVAPSKSPTRGSRRKTLIPLACAAALGVGAAVVAAGPSVSAATGDTAIQILSFNDYHGHVESGTPGSIDGSFRGPAAGGGEFLSAKLTELRGDRGAGETYTVAAGDLIGGSPFFSGLFHDEPSVESLNAMGLDFSGVGNHEFDEGVTELLRMQNGGNHPTDNGGNGFFTDYDTDTPGDQEFPGADFQWLAANVTEDVPDGTDDFEDSIPDYEIVTAADGKKIAFIGMTLEGTDELVAAAGTVGFTFEDEITAGNAAVEAIQLEDSAVEAIIVMLHEGGIPSPFAINGCAGISGPIVTIAAGLSAEIDAIVTGHTHQPYTCSIADPDTNLRPVTSAFSYGRVVTEINLELDETGEVDRDTFTMLNHEVLQELPTDDPEVFKSAATDPAVTAIIDRWTPLSDALGLVEVGAITADITRGGDPTGSDRGVESSAGNLVADAQLESTQSLAEPAVMAFMNPGGLRSDLPFEKSEDEADDGIVTFAEAFSFQPFNNTMFVLPMTGAQIKAVLAEQCQPGDSSRPVLHLGVSDGITYDLDITQQAGVCTAVEITNLKLDGTDVDDATTYNVAVNNFLADGGDNFETFAEVAADDRTPGGQDIDALTDYLAANSPVTPPGTDRVNETGMTLPAPMVSLNPARLLETRTGPEDKTVDNLFEGAGPIAAGGEIELTVAGRGDVPADAEAVVLNIGVIRAEDRGYLTVYPCGQERPLASSVNYAADTVNSSSVLAKVSTEGTVCIYSSRMANLYADVQSAVPSNGSPVAVVPARLLETRVGDDNTTVDGLFEGGGPIMAGTEVELVVTERGEAPDVTNPVPADAKAVVLNIGAINPDEQGFLTVYPCGEDRPLASNVNYGAGKATSNSVTAKIGVDGKVCIYSSKTTEAIADINAFIPADGSPEPLLPARLLDTRDGDTNLTIDNEFEDGGTIPGGGIVELLVADRGDVQADDETVVLNVGAVRPPAQGFLTVYPCGEDRPLASIVNYRGGDVVSNSVTAKVGIGGKVCIYVSSETHLIADVVGTVRPVIPAFPAED